MPSDNPRDGLPRHYEGRIESGLRRIIEEFAERFGRRAEQPRRIRARMVRPPRGKQSTDDARKPTASPTTNEAGTPPSLQSNLHIPEQRWPLHDEEL